MILLLNMTVNNKKQIVSLTTKTESGSWNLLIQTKELNLLRKTVLIYIQDCDLMRKTKSKQQAQNHKTMTVPFTLKLFKVLD